MIVELNTEYPATTRKPRPSKLGMVVHEMIDISMYAGSAEQARYLDAGEDTAEQREALATMPNATVTFQEVPAGEPFFAEA